MTPIEHKNLEAFDEMLQALKDAKRIIEELRNPRDISSFVVLVDIEEAIAKGGREHDRERDPVKP